MILVTGATGDIGGELCRLLAEASEPFRAMCRKQEQIDRFRDQGIDAVLGDFDRPDTLEHAMKGCDRLFLVSHPTPRQFEQEKAAIDAASRAGVSRIVKVSASDANVKSPVPWAKAHALIDHHLRASGLEWTILKPTAFMQNFLWSKKPISRGYLPQAAGSGKVAYIDNRDVARVALTVLTQQGHAHATYFLTGPQPLDMQMIAQRLSAAIGRKVRYINLPNLIFEAVLRVTGNSRWKAKGLVVQFSDVVAGSHAIDPTFEIERLTGEPARDFGAFAREHRSQMAGQAG